MSVNEEKAFRAVCDKCGRVFEDRTTGSTIFEDELDLQEALASSWWQYRGEVICPDCLSHVDEGSEDDDEGSDYDTDTPEIDT